MSEASVLANTAMPLTGSAIERFELSNFVNLRRLALCLNGVKCCNQNSDEAAQWTGIMCLGRMKHEAIKQMQGTILGGACAPGA
ncbi:hypothetical protein ABBQ38_001273 [Trebouxia sp. C0009 RCD-2024]